MGERKEIETEVSRAYYDNPSFKGFTSDGRLVYDTDNGRMTFDPRKYCAETIPLFRNNK